MTIDKTFPLPRVAIFDMKKEQYVAILYGPHAETLGSDILDSLPDDPNGDTWDYCISDDQCADCGEMFSHEARELEKGKVVCPHCFGDPKDPAAN